MCKCTRLSKLGAARKDRRLSTFGGVPAALHLSTLFEQNFCSNSKKRNNATCPLQDLLFRTQGLSFAFVEKAVVLTHAQKVRPACTSCRTTTHLDGTPADFLAKLEKFLVAVYVYPQRSIVLGPSTSRERCTINPSVYN